MDAAATNAKPIQPLPYSILKGPNGLRAGWRLLIYAALLCVLGFVAYKISAALLRGQEPDMATPIAGMIYTAVLFSIALLTAGTMAIIEGRSIADYGLPWRRLLCKQFWQAATISFVSLTLLLFALWGAGSYSPGSLQLHGTEIWTNAFLWAVTLTLGAVVEEFFYRGYLMFTVTTGIGFWPAALATSLLMAWVHHFNPG